MTRDLASDLIKHHLPSLFDHLDTQLLSSIRIATTRLPYDGNALNSKFGGLPRLPTGIPWPHWDGRAYYQSSIDYYLRSPMAHRGPAFDGMIKNLEEARDRGPRPLHFIAQLALSELPAIYSINLPTAGHLLFFYAAEDTPGSYDPAARGAGEVIYVAPGDIPNEVVQQPPGLSVFIPAALDFSAQWTLPAYPNIKSIGPSAPAFNAYSQLLNDLYEPSSILHRIGGHSQPVQNDMRLEAQLVTNGIWCGDASGYNDPRRPTLEQGVQDWQLLLQVDTDEDGPGWMWGDVGRLYFWIRRQDLAKRDFSQIFCAEQCH
jgi:hypothetical protein